MGHGQGWRSKFSGRVRAKGSTLRLDQGGTGNFGGVIWVVGQLWDVVMVEGSTLGAWPGQEVQVWAVVTVFS